MNKPLNTGQARVIDPLLSNVARGYSNAEFIFPALFPRVTIPQRGGRVIRFGKEHFRRKDARRAPGASTRRIQTGYASDPVAIVQESLEGTVAFEVMQEADTVPGIDLGSEAVNTVMETLHLNLETECSALALNSATYDINHKLALSGTDQWDDYANSDPIADVKAAREAVRLSIGRYPNTFVIGADVFAILQEHPKILEKIKYTSRDSVTEEILARIFQVDRVVVGKAIYLAEDAAENDPGIDIWGGAAILAWVPQSGQNFRVPSYGYTYELPGMPLVEEPYQERNIKSWVYPTTYDRNPYIVGAESGFLIQTPILGG